MTKSPYEIRLELLQLATTVLTNRMVPNPRNTTERIAYEPTTEEIMDEAKKLNMFITHSKCVCNDCKCNPCKCTDGKCDC